MKKLLSIIIILFAIYSCKNSSKVERENEPTIYNVEHEDAEMNDAIKKANRTLNEFNIALKSNDSNNTFFGLKMRFKAEDRNEHIWIGNIKQNGNKYYGVVDNLPEYTTEVKQGDTIEIDKEKISDWMYLKNSELRGGYTIRLLRNRMTEAERKQFDAESGMIIK
jgi:uncharacterized protein YegJ (DUF2314 family)